MSSIVSPNDIFTLEDHERYLSVTNWNDVPINATHLGVGAPHQDLSRLSEFHSLEHLRLCCGDEVLSSLSDMPKLRRLRISSVARVPLTSLDSLCKVPNLERLILHHVPMVHSLDSISVLVKLKDLLIENNPGSITKLHELDSLQPLMSLKSLERLELRGIRVREQGLRPLENMTWLQTLVVNNNFKIEDFARLAAALPNTQGFCLQPAVPIAMPCERCQAEKVMLIGRTRPQFACPQCQSRHVTRHVAAFGKIKLEWILTIRAAGQAGQKKVSGQELFY